MGATYKPVIVSHAAGTLNRTARQSKHGRKDSDLPVIMHSSDDLLSHLREQREFLARSASAFDQGSVAEAKRMALAVRILVHQTRRSNALLNQLEVLETMEFFDSANGTQPLAYMIRSAGEDPQWIAFLDERAAEVRCRTMAAILRLVEHAGHPG